MSPPDTPVKNEDEDEDHDHYVPVDLVELHETLEWADTVDKDQRGEN